MGLALLAVLASVSAGAWWELMRDVPPPPPTSPVTRAAIEETILASGTLKAVRAVDVGAQVTGQIKTLHVAIGDSVQTGDAIAEIDDTTKRNDLLKAQATLKQNKAQRAAKVATLKKAELEYKRQKRMLAREATSQKSFEAARADRLTAKASVAQLDAQIVEAKIAVDTAEAALRYTKIVSPIDGIVVSVPVKEGQTINAVQSAPNIATVAQLNRMTVEAEISEADVVRVKPGQRVYFTILGNPDKRYQATLRAVELEPRSSGSDKAVYYNGLFEVDNPGHMLRIGMTAEVSIILDRAEDALTIPASALGGKEPDGRYRVTVVKDDGAFEQRLITVGIDNNVTVQVTGGLKEGEQVLSTSRTGVLADNSEDD